MHPALQLSIAKASSSIVPNDGTILRQAQTQQTKPSCDAESRNQAQATLTGGECFRGYTILDI